MLVHLHFNSPEWWLKLIYSEQVEYSRQTGWCIAFHYFARIACSPSKKSRNWVIVHLGCYLWCVNFLDVAHEHLFHVKEVMKISVSGLNQWVFSLSEGFRGRHSLQESPMKTTVVRAGWFYFKI
jgi:hypothetical protein